MIEVKNKKNPIAGYMGFTPSAEERDDNQGQQIESHIPGYVGYIPAVKAQNLYAHTYGKITEDCAKKNYPKGIQYVPEVKYKSTTKGTYVHPAQVKNQQSNEGRINGVKISTFSNAAKMMMNTGTNFKNNKECEAVTTLTYEEACQKAYC